MAIDPMNPNWGNLAQDQEKTRLVQQMLLNNKQNTNTSQLDLQTAIRKAVIEGKLKPKSGVTVNPLDMNKEIDYNQFETANPEMDIIKSVLGSQTGTGQENISNQILGGGFRPEGFSVGGIDFKRQPTPEERQQVIQQKVEEAKALESGKGLSIETGGKLAMVKQAKRDIDEARQMLFPKNTPESFSRSRAFVSNLPGSRAPIIGAVIPQAMPFNEMGQKIYSRLQNAVAAKLRVETGAQANPSEVENILARFGVTSASDAKAAWDALNRLENFMDETINITDPSGRFTGKSKTNDLKSKYGLE